MSTFVIAEVGVNHNGSTEWALQLIDAAKRVGADAVKLQCFTPSAIVSPHAPLARYQARRSDDATQMDLLGPLALSRTQVRQLMDHATRVGIELFATAFDVDWLRFCFDNGMGIAKVPSGEITNPELLDAIGASGRPVLCSTGMASLGDIDWALNRLRAAGALNVTLLHCTSAYPAPLDQCDLRNIETLRQAFGVPVGFSDHTEGTTACVAAVALGATVLEKHFTLDRTLPGPDHAASIEPDEFAFLVRSVREAEVALGSALRTLRPAEVDTQMVARRSVALAHDTDAGTRIDRSHLSFLRPGTGIDPREVERVVGRTLAVSRRTGELLSWTDFAHVD